jgi:phage terminase small subunit
MKRIEDSEITPKEERFCYEYVLHLNATKAAILAGYSERSARQIANRQLTKEDIQNRIKHLQGNLSETAEISALRVLKEHEKIAFSNAGQLRDGWITLKEFETLTEEQLSCIQEVSSRQAKKVSDKGEIIIEEWVKIKLYDKQKSLDSIKAMLGFDAPEIREISGKDGAPLIPQEMMTEEEILSEIEKIRKARNVKQ